MAQTDGATNGRERHDYCSPPRPEKAADADTNFQKGGGIKTVSVDFDPTGDPVTVELGE
jgi:hypothetical protein